METDEIRKLLDKRDDLDAEIAALITGTKERKAIRCSKCGEENHTARTCKKNGDNPQS